MKFLKYVFIVIVSIALTITVFAGKIKPLYKESAINEVSFNTLGASKSFSAFTTKLEKQVKSLGQIISDDMDFAMKLSIDGDISAPEISEFALKYMDAMGFSFLEVIDTSYTILSSGHFPSSNGNIAMDLKDLPENSAVILRKELKGEKYQALLIKIPFNCAGIKLFAVGGVIIDDAFLNNLSPNSKTTVLMKIGDEIIGMNVSTISEINDHKIIINDSTYFASSTSLSIVESPELIVIREEPADVTLFDLFK